MKSIASMISSLQSELHIPGGGNLFVGSPSSKNQIKPNGKVIKTKEVRFSELSNLRFYFEDYTYVKSYTKADRKVFGKRLLYAAHKIRSTLASTDADSSVSMARRLESCGIMKEELIGLEGLVLEKSPSDVAKLRKLLVKAVLLEQTRQEILCHVDDERIGEISRSYSIRSRDKARERANATA